MTDTSPARPAQIASVSSRALRVAIDNYRGSITSYYKYLSIIHPVLEGLPAEQEKESQEGISRMLSTFMKGASKAESKEFIDVLKAVTIDVSSAAAKGSGTPAATVTISSSPAPENLSASYDVSPRVGSLIMSIFKTFRTRVPAAGHRDILYRGVLTGIVGQFEVLISDLAHHFYRRAPGSMGAQERALTVSELLSFGSLDEATDYVISEKVDDLLRGSAEDWRKFFDSRLKVDLCEVTSDWSRFIEYIQRRHLVVHAGSRLSRRYLKIVDPALIKECFGDAAAGHPVPFTAPYVDGALNAFESAGILLGFTCWAKLHSDHAEDQSSLLSDYIYETMLAQRWSVVHRLAAWGANQKAFDANSRLICQCNAWLALKRLGRFAECSDEVRQLDCSAIKSVFAIARAALLDDLDDFFRIVEETKASDFDERAWREWPILDEARLDFRFEQLRTRYSEKPSGNASVGLQLPSPSDTPDASLPSESSTVSIDQAELPTSGESDPLAS